MCGVADYRIQRRLLAEPTLTFEKAKDIALAMELADTNTADLREQNQRSDMVNKIAFAGGRRMPTQRQFSEKHSRCGRCGEGPHKQGADCPAIDGRLFPLRQKGSLRSGLQSQGNEKGPKKSHLSAAGTGQFQQVPHLSNSRGGHRGGGKRNIRVVSTFRE